MRHLRPSAKASLGFAYLSLLIFLALLGFVSAMALQVGSLVHRRVAEEALLDIGFEYAKALGSYADQTPVGMEDQPMNLQELLLDKRLPGRVRHLRQLYPDPVTGGQEWGLDLDPDTNRIIGIFSLSDKRPIKIDNFPLGFYAFRGKSRLNEWVFTADIVASIERREDGRNREDKKFINPSTLIDRSKLKSTAPTVPRTDGFISPNELKNN
jgi:hypothetical protein